jgi:hypothetical protein
LYTQLVRKATFLPTRPRGCGEYRIPAYDTKKVPLDSDDDWHFALADKPWSQETMRSKTLEYMSLKIEADDADLQEEGTHAMWEFAANKAHHETFTHEVRLRLLLSAQPPPAPSRPLRDAAELPRAATSLQQQPTPLAPPCMRFERGGTLAGQRPANGLKFLLLDM